MASKPLTPPRFTAAIVKSNNFLDDSWAKWVRDLYEKVKELESTNTALAARVTALETEVTTLSGGVWHP